MSMPSSRLEVATTAGSRPAFSASSISVRSCRETDPWCARAMTTASASASPPGTPPAATKARSVASSLSRPHSRSASRRELANTIVDRCAWIRSSTRSSTCGQIDRRATGSSSPSPAAAVPPCGRHIRQVPHVLDRDDDLKLDLLRAGGLHHGHRPRPAEERGDLRRRPHRGRQPDPLRPPGRRIRLQRVEPLKRQRQVRAPLGPGDRVDLVHDDRLDPAQRLPRLRGEQQEQRFRGGDEDVGRLASRACAALRPRCPRSAPPPGCPARAARAAAPPARSRSAASAGSARCRPPGPSAARRRAPGMRRFLSAGGGAAASRSIAHRNAASVLPEPVGAMTSVSSPLPIARHACACAWVGTAKAPSNHARVAVENPSSAAPLLTGSLPPDAACPFPAIPPVCPHPPTFQSNHPARPIRPPGSSAKDAGYFWPSGAYQGPSTGPAGGSNYPT